MGQAATAAQASGGRGASRSMYYEREFAAKLGGCLNRHSELGERQEQLCIEMLHDATRMLANLSANLGELQLAREEQRGGLVDVCRDFASSKQLGAFSDAEESRAAAGRGNEGAAASAAHLRNLAREVRRQERSRGPSPTSVADSLVDEPPRTGLHALPVRKRARQQQQQQAAAVAGTAPKITPQIDTSWMPAEEGEPLFKNGVRASDRERFATNLCEPQTKKNVRTATMNELVRRLKLRGAPSTLNVSSSVRSWLTRKNRGDAQLEPPAFRLSASRPLAPSPEALGEELAAIGEAQKLGNARQ